MFTIAGEYRSSIAGRQARWSPRHGTARPFGTRVTRGRRGGARRRADDGGDGDYGVSDRVAGRRQVFGRSTSSGSANRSRTAAVNATFRIVPTLILAIPARTARCRSSPETPEDPCAPQARAAVFAADFAELGFQEQPSVVGLAASTRAPRHPPGAAHPDAFRPGLAASLHNQSTALAGLARREDALAASEEVVAICRELIAIVPVFRQSLARSLTSFGIRLTEKKDFDAALSADREAVAIYAALLSLFPRSPAVSRSVGEGGPEPRYTPEGSRARRARDRRRTRQLVIG